MPKLYDVLKAGYDPKSKSAQKLQNRGFIKDEELSNHNQQVYYNKNNGKLLYNINGTHNLSDVGTDVYLAAGKLKNTNRYKEARSVLEKAKKKYNTENASISGHSLGGAIAQYVSSKNDNTITLDKGATIGQKTRNNESSYRTKGDVVSTFAQKTKTLDNPYKSLIDRFNPLKAHNVDNIKNNNIRV
jgi:hypothetical protein